jgi:hypothetical protein
MAGKQFAVTQHRRSVPARRHRFGKQALRPADLRGRQSRSGQQAQVIEPVRQVGRLQGGNVGELEAPVGVAAVEPAGLHRVQPGDDLPAGAGRGPALTGRHARHAPLSARPATAVCTITVRGPAAVPTAPGHKTSGTGTRGRDPSRGCAPAGVTESKQTSEVDQRLEQEPRPFIWIKTADEILGTVAACCQ